MPFPININDDCLMTTKKTMTTNAGTPVAENQNVQTAGPHGPMLMQNVWYMEKLAHFTRERIPERVVHAKGSAAYGTFTVTKDITKYTKASIFSEVGKQTDLFVRFRPLPASAALPIPSAMCAVLRSNFTPTKVTGIWWGTIHRSFLSGIRSNFPILSTRRSATRKPTCAAQRRRGIFGVSPRRPSIR